MSRLALFVVCAATAVVTVSSAEARDNCGRGWFFNGVACVQQEGPGYGYRPEPPRYSQEPRYYQEQRYDDGPRYRGGGGGQMYRGRDGQMHCSNSAYTVQDGVCKPYRGG
jgi:hypothetical protein